MRVVAAIREKLGKAFEPTRLRIVDESHKHAGHAGARPEGETHFRIEIVSKAFEGLSRIARQRLVHRVLEGELRSEVHALQLTTLTPEEAKDERSAAR